MITLGHIIALKISSWYNNQLGLNVLHFRCAASTGGGMTETEVALAMEPVVTAVLLPLLAVPSQYLGLSVKDLSNVPATASGVSGTLAGNGLGGAVALPTQVSGLITLRTPLSGRRGRGRCYIPFPAVTDNAAGDIPTGAYVTKLQNFATAVFTPQALVGGVGTASFIPVVKPATGLAVIDIIATQARTSWATQRRRGNYGRTNPQMIAV
jgi:hypothetical protein